MTVSSHNDNPCLECGACCAFFRVSFYWAEADDATPGGVPAELTEDFNNTYRFMKGTGGPVPRCAALRGEIGGSVFCSIHSRRPSPCRNFTLSFSSGERNERCDKARAAHGLPPMSPHD